MSSYAVIIEGDGETYSAYVPDLPGCIAAGRNVAEVERLIGEAIELHIEALRETGDPVPPPTSGTSAVSEVHPAS